MPKLSAKISETQDGVSIGNTGDKLGFLGASPAVQRTGSSQAAVATTALSASGSYTQAEITALATRCAALTTLANEMRAVLVLHGLMKGSA